MRKTSPDFWIDDADALEGSELSYRDDEVTALRLVLTGAAQGGTRRALTP